MHSIYGRFCRIIKFNAEGNIPRVNLYTITMKKVSVDFVIKLLLISLCAFFVFNFPLLQSLLTKTLNLLSPVIIGVILFLAMNVPYSLFNNKIYRKVPKQKIRRVLSLVSTLVLFGGVLTLMGFLIIPQAISGIKDLLSIITSGNALETITNVKILTPFADQIKNLLNDFLSKFTQYLPKIIGILESVFSGIYNLLFGLIIAIMLLVNKNSVIDLFKKIISLITKGNSNKVLNFVNGAVEKFSKYLGGQVIEAFILGFACYIVMSLLKVPYSALVSLIIGFANLIPILGAYVGGAICTVIIFSVDPTKAIVFLIAVVILQQIENFTTYPIIVGRYVGLNSFWITVSIIIWGGIMGVTGMILGVPLTAFLYDLFEKHYAKKSIENSITNTKNLSS